MKEKVTIIFPVYNVEKYIEKSLKSILGQTYNNLEVIIIDDGSCDKSVEIYKKYEKEDNRIKVIKQENKGLSEARNKGLEKTTGKYVMFVDSDDWLDNNCVEKCVEAMIENNAEIVMFSRINEYKLKQVKKYLFKNDMIFIGKSKENLLRRLFGLYREELKEPLKLEELNTAWAKLYCYELISNKKFIDTKIIGSEDGIFNISNFFEAKKIVYINNIFYHYRKDNIFSLTKLYKSNLYDQFQEMYKIMENFIDEKKMDDKNKEALNNRKVINLITFFINIVTSNLSFFDKEKEIRSILEKEEYKKIFEKFNFKYLTLKWKSFFLLCKYKKSWTILFFMLLGVKMKGK